MDPATFFLPCLQILMYLGSFFFNIYTMIFLFFIRVGFLLLAWTAMPLIDLTLKQILRCLQFTIWYLRESFVGVLTWIKSSSGAR
jgi:hypothetical protein